MSDRTPSHHTPASPLAPQKFASITSAAVAMALGGKFVTTSEEQGRLFFIIEPPANVDLGDPALLVPVVQLSAWVPVLSRKLQAFKGGKGAR